MHLSDLRRTALAVGVSLALAGASAAPAVADTAGDTTGAGGGAGAWQLVGPNAGGGRLAFTPADPSRLYVLPDIGDRVYRTDDHGTTWSEEPALGVPGAVGSRLAADPRDPDRVYVVADNLGTGQGYVLRSDDAGRSFRPVLDDAAGFTDVVTSPSGDDVFVAGAAGVFASQDHGGHWHRLPGAPVDATRLGLDGNDLLVGTSAGISLVQNALGHPKEARKLTVPGNPPVSDLSVHGRVAVSSELFSGAVISTDRGRSWSRLAGPWNAGDAITYSGITAAGELQVQAIEGTADDTGARTLWVSRDLGRTWTAKPEATGKLDVYNDTGNFPDRPSEQVVSASAGVYTTHDSATFRRIGVPSTEVDALAVTGSAVVAGTPTGTYRSSAPLASRPPAGYQDWGWTGRAPATIGNTVTALATAGGTALLRTRSTYCSDSCFLLERSTDGGRSWQQLSQADGTSDALAVDPRRPSTVYAASYYPGGVYTSTDGGSTLQFHQAPELEGVKSVAVDPRATGALWIGDVSGLYHTTDSGDTVVKAFDGTVDRVAVDPADPDHVVAVGEHLLKVSHDGGKTYRDAQGVPELTYDDIVFGPHGTVFVASRDLYEPGQGVLRSTDGGTHWTGISTGLVSRDVHSLSVSPDGRLLFAGTGTGGVFRLALH